MKNPHHATNVGMIPRMVKWLLPVCIAGILAVVFWPKPAPLETDIFIPIEMTGLPKGLALAGTPIKGVEIRIRGPEPAVKDLQNRQLSYHLDLSAATAGLKSTPIHAERLGFPREVAILHIHPDPLVIKIEKEITKEVPVGVNIYGKPASGFYLVKAEPIPPVVVLRGPENRLAPVKEIRTKPIDVTGARESIKKEVALDLQEGIQPVSQNGVILAELTIRERVATRTFAGVSVKGKNARYQFTVTPPLIEIEIKGPVTTLEKLGEKGIDVYVDLQGLAHGVYPRRAVISLPMDATLLRATPELFTVKIEPRALGRTAEPAPPLPE